MKFKIKLSLALVFLASLTYWFFFNVDGVLARPLLNNFEDPMHLPTSSNVYHRGDTVYIKVKYCKLRDYSVSTQWNLENTITVPYVPTQKKNTAVGCYGVDKERDVAVGEIPLHAELGMHHFVGDTTYTEYNPFDTRIVVHYETVYFNIIP